MKKSIKRIAAIVTAIASLTAGINCFAASATNETSEAAVFVSLPYHYSASYSFWAYKTPQACTYEVNGSTQTSIIASYSNMKISFVQASGCPARIVVHDNTTNSDVNTFVIPSSTIPTQTIFVNTTATHSYSFSAITDGNDTTEGTFYVEY